VKTAAFSRTRVTAVKIEMNKRTYIFPLPRSLSGRYTLQALARKAGGLQVAKPAWKGTRLDVFGVLSDNPRRTPNTRYCNNFGFHSTPYYAAAMDGRSHCAAVARLGTVLGSSTACARRNGAKPNAAEGLGVWNSCTNKNAGAGRVDGNSVVFKTATVWVM